jgi:2-polyprenyl-6-methoxyphenol hydroxylase-like FAD-dependent oxidoreductase
VFFFLLSRSPLDARWHATTLRGGQPASARPSLADLADVLPTAGSGYMTLPGWAYFGLQHRHAARYRAGRILWLGTPADVHSPAGARA